MHFGCFPGSISDGDAAVRRVGLPGFGLLRGVDEPDPWGHLEAAGVAYGNQPLHLGASSAVDDPVS